MNKKTFAVRITETDNETGETKELLDENENTFKSIMLLGTTEDDQRIGEILVNTSLLDMANMIVNGRKAKMAALLGLAMDRINKVDSENNIMDMEDLLKGSLEGGVQ